MMGEFVDSLKYPFSKVGCLLIFWVMLVPVVGPFVFMGYLLRLVSSIVLGENEAPEFGGFFENLKNGFLLFIFTFVAFLVLFILMVLLFLVPVVGVFAAGMLMVLFYLVFSVMVLQFAEDGFGSGFNVFKAVRMIFSAPVDFIFTMAKVLVVALILNIASVPIVTLVVTLPAMIFSSWFLFGKFYARNSHIEFKLDAGTVAGILALVALVVVGGIVYGSVAQLYYDMLSQPPAIEVAGL